MDQTCVDPGDLTSQKQSQTQLRQPLTAQREQDLENTGEADGAATTLKSPSADWKGIQEVIPSKALR